MNNAALNHLKRAILEILRAEQGRPVRANDIATRLGIKSTDRRHNLLREALQALVVSSEITRLQHRRYAASMPRRDVVGRISFSRYGTATVEVEGGESEEIVIRRSQLGTSLDGDRVRIKLLAQRPGGKPEGEVVEVLERHHQTIVGTVERRGDLLVVVPDDNRIDREILVLEQRAAGARPGDKVDVRLLDWTDARMAPEGEVIEVLGRSGLPRVEILAIAKEYRLPLRFPDEVEAEAQAAPAAIPESEARRRLDLRGTTVFTIDPDDAKDFDDAVSLDDLGGGRWRLGVHIADVSHFVRESSPIDREAYRRGTSVYLVNGVIPMLPERLSNDLCSLRPDVERLTYSCIMTVTTRGAIEDYEIRRSIIRSRRRFTYDEVAQIIESGEGDHAETIGAMHRLAQTFTRKRLRAGSIDFELPELKFILDEDGYPIDVKPKPRNAATRLIEEFMLLANQTVAKHVGAAREQGPARKNAERAPFLYRVHDPPHPEKIAELATFVKQFGYSLDTTAIKPKAIAALLDQVRGKPEAYLINGITLRSMTKAIYSDFNTGHFGLAFPYYAHFTSPIRRYPDLIVHRMLAEYEEGMPPARRAEYASRLGEIGEHSSLRERNAVEAERESVKYAQVEFIERHVGDEFDGVISGVTSFGFFVDLRGVFAEGLVRLRDLADDYYVFDEKNYSLRGRRAKRTFRFGDSVRVQVLRVDKDRRRIDLGLVEPARVPKRSR